MIFFTIGSKLQNVQYSNHPINSDLTHRNKIKTIKFSVFSFWQQEREHC